jgi:hypothetical protein
MKTLSPIQTWWKSRIERFTQTQRPVREWINFADIADFCSRESGSIVPDEKKRTVALDTLAKDVLRGEFDKNGRSQVLYLNHFTKKVRLTREDLADIIEHNLDGNHGLSEYLPHCWTRREFVERWLEKHRQKPPDWLKPNHGWAPTPELRSDTLRVQNPVTVRATTLFEMSSAGGKRSGIARRANRPWTGHASELAIEAHSREPNLSNEKIVAKISDNWKLERPNCPGSRTLAAFVAQLRKTRVLPQRSGSLQKRSG